MGRYWWVLPDDRWQGLVLVAVVLFVVADGGRDRWSAGPDCCYE